MRSVLGRGLAALIPVRTTEKNSHVVEIAIHEVSPNPGQPRKRFNEEKLAELAHSVKELGLIQPIVVAKVDRGYQIVVGERRWRAAKAAGLATIPAIVKELEPQQRVVVALVENLQRDDLNALEEAEAFDFLIKKLGLTQEDLSKRIGRSRPYITNTLRLLHLPETVKSLVVDGKLSPGHARAILSANDGKLAEKLALRVIEEELSVRQIENLLKPKITVARENRAQALVGVEKKLRGVLGARVRIRLKHGKGKLEILYSSVKELRKFISLLLEAGQVMNRG